MKVLLDECIAPGVALQLAEAGFEVVHVLAIPSLREDSQILDFAFREKMILATIDKDFGKLAMQDSQPHCGIIRVVGATSAQQVILIGRALELHGENLLKGGLTVIGPKFIRHREPDFDKANS
jgi:predicted nuclease of predicted toxin-antitoxin system